MPTQCRWAISVLCFATTFAPFAHGESTAHLHPYLLADYGVVSRDGAESFGGGAGLRWQSGFGAEASWQRLVDLPVTTTIISNPLLPGGSTIRSISRYQVSSVALFATYAWQFAPDWTFGARLGGSRQNQDNPLTGASPQLKVAFGTRVQYQISEDWSVAADWSQFRIDVGIRSVDLDRYALQLGYHF